MNLPLKSIPLIGYACGIGAENPLCSKGPSQLQSSPYIQVPHHWVKILTPKGKLQHLAALNDIVDISQCLAKETHQLTHKKQFFVTIGGDHSSAIGTWSGVAASLAPNKLGLIWIDAHLDSHTFETTPSGNIHGMPLAILLGKGNRALTKIENITPKLLPENVYVIGIRSYEEEEKSLLEQLNVRIHYIDEVKKRGLDSIIQEIIHKLENTCYGFGLSLDLDALNPDQAPGVGTPVVNGINVKDLYNALNSLMNSNQFLAAEIAEFNPVLDEDHKTEKIIGKILEQFSKNNRDKE